MILDILIILMVVVVLLYGAHRLLGGSREKETRVQEATETATEYFERTHATITYPDGSTEDVVYDSRDDTEDGRIILTSYDEDCFNVGRSSQRGHHRHRPTVKTRVPDENKRTFSLVNVRDIDPNWTDPLVVAFEVEVEKKQERLGENRWRTLRMDWDWRDEYDCTIWEQAEWEVHKEQL